MSALEQATRILTLRFCRQPWTGRFPKGVPLKGVQIAAPASDLPDELAWDMFYGPVWAILCRAIAASKSGVSMYGPTWTITERKLEGSPYLMVEMIDTPDPAVLMDALNASPGPAFE